MTSRPTLYHASPFELAPGTILVPGRIAPPAAIGPFTWRTDRVY